MSNRINLLVAIVAVALVAGGCANTANQPKKLTRVSPASSGGSKFDNSPSALDIAPTPPSSGAPVMGAYQPAPQPVVYDTAPAASATAAAPTATASAAPDLAPTATASTNGSYKVKKGDTLFSIAKKNYGDGKQWRKIATANPGVSPTTLKAGQVLALP